MGTLDQPTGTNVERKIHIEDVSAYTIPQVQNYFNDNLGSKGWRIVQIIQLGTKTYIIAEREL